jgi:hypothetical protein
MEIIKSLCSKNIQYICIRSIFYWVFIGLLIKLKFKKNISKFYSKIKVFKQKIELNKKFHFFSKKITLATN